MMKGPEKVFLSINYIDFSQEYPTNKRIVTLKSQFDSALHCWVCDNYSTVYKNARTNFQLVRNFRGLKTLYQKNLTVFAQHKIEMTLSEYTIISALLYAWTYPWVT